MANSDPEFGPFSATENAARLPALLCALAKNPRRIFDRIPRRNSRRAGLGLALALLAAAANASDALHGLCSVADPTAPGCDRIRARVTAPLGLPYSAIGRVAIDGSDTHCTGTLIANRTVLTAAHCLWDGAPDTGIAAARISFTTSADSAANPGQARVLSVAFAFPPVDGRPPDPAHDIALLTLDQPLGDIHGVLRLFRGKLRLVGPGTAILAGYAGLDPARLTLARDCGQPLAVSGQLMAACSAMPGDSGAPLLWQGQDGSGTSAVFLLGVTTAVSAGTAPMTTRFAPWFRLRDAVGPDKQIAN